MVFQKIQNRARQGALGESLSIPRALQNAVNWQQFRKITANLVRFSARALTGAVLIFSRILTGGATQYRLI